MDSLLSTEMAAAKYRLLGPASTSAAWPLDGPFTGFELTPANEDAYYMHVTIRRVAAAVRARADYEKKLGKDGSTKRQAALAAENGWGKPHTDIVEADNQLTAKEEKRAKELEKMAAVAASSPALLYTCGEFLEEESILRDSLSVLRATAKEDAQRYLWCSNPVCIVSLVLSACCVLTIRSVALATVPLSVYMSGK